MAKQSKRHMGQKVYSTESVDSINVDSAGNVGIGTASPDSKLHIVGPGSGSNFAALRVGYNNTAVSYYDASSHYFRGAGGVDSTVKMTLDANGNLTVGTTSSSAGAATVRTHIAGSEFGLGISVPTTGAQQNIRFVNGTTAVGSVVTSGSGTTYNTISDHRLKEDVKPMSGALNRVAALKPVTYKWKSDGSEGEGFIAHELAEVCPLAVTGEKDAVNEDGSIAPQGIDPSKLIGLLTAAIQELKAELDQAKAEIAALRKQP